MTKARSNATAPAAKGQIVVGTGTDASGILSVGSANQVLTVDSSTATGLKWATASSGPTGWSLLNAGGTALTGAQTITVSGISAKELLVLVAGASSASAGSAMFLRFNSDSAQNYSVFGVYNSVNTSYASTFLDTYGQYSTQTQIRMGTMGSSVTSIVSGSCYVDLADTTGWKRYDAVGSGNAGAGNDWEQWITQGFYEASAAITSVSLVSQTGNFDAGTLYVLGAN